MKQAAVRCRRRDVSLVDEKEIEAVGETKGSTFRSSAAVCGRWGPEDTDDVRQDTYIGLSPGRCLEVEFDSLFQYLWSLHYLCFCLSHLSAILYLTALFYSTSPVME